jgi:hypothetical protein
MRRSSDASGRLMRGGQAGHHSAAHTMAALPQRKEGPFTMGTDKPTSDDLTTLAVRLREHASRIDMITLKALQNDLIAAAKALEDAAMREDNS